jgi:hypothetical protein
VTDEGRQYGYLQQDSATVHAAQIQWLHYKRCLMTESLVQDCGLQDHQVFVFVTSVCGGT